MAGTYETSESGSGYEYEEDNGRTENNKINGSKNEGEKAEIFQEYERYNYPVILLDLNLKIIYKNTAAKFANIRPRIGMNIKKYTNLENLLKLMNTLKNKTINTVQLNIRSSIKQCVSRFDQKVQVISLIFFDSLNYLREDDHETVNKINNIISKYDEQIEEIFEFTGNLIADIADIKDIKENHEVNIDNISTNNIINIIYKNNKKILRLREHFRKSINNLNLNGSEQYKNYCDIGRFLRCFDEGTSLYINNLGYKMIFDIEDKMFMYKINEGDFLTVNFILAAFAFDYSVFGRINVKFWTDIWSESGINSINNIIGILRYEFTAPKDFECTHKDMFIKNYLESIGGIEYLDLSLAALIAKNNGLKLDVRFNEDQGRRVYMDLLFNSKLELHSSFPKDYMNIVTADLVKKKAEIEFSMLNKFVDNCKSI